MAAPRVLIRASRAYALMAPASPWTRTMRSASTQSVASQVLKDMETVQESILNRHVFLGTSQYFSADSDADMAGASEPAVPSSRFVVCSLGENIRDDLDVVELYDEVLPAEEGHEVLVNTLKGLGSLSVVHGEVDAIARNQWEYGYFQDPSLTIFNDTTGRVSNVGVHENGDVCVFKYSSDGSREGFVPVVDVSRVIVDLSEDTSVRSLDIERRSDKQRFTVVELKELPHATDDVLAMLMTTTEWLVKAAGHLTLDVARGGGNAKFQVHELLTEKANPWVRQRNQRWRELAQKQA